MEWFSKIYISILILCFDSSQVKTIDMSNFDFSIENSAETNTNSINAVIRSLSNGGVIKVSKPGVYRIQGASANSRSKDYLRDEGGIEMQDNITLLLSNGVIFKQESTFKDQYNIIRIYNKSNVKIQGGQIIGDRYSHASESGEWGYGIAISGGQNITIKDIKISDCWGDGINIQNVIRSNILLRTKGVNIERVICVNNRRQGMSIEGGEMIRIKESEFSNTNGTSPESGVDIEPWHHLSSVNDVIFDKCIFANNSHAGLISGGSAPISNIKVKNCFFSNNKINKAFGGQCTFYKYNRDINISNCKFNKGSDGSIYGVSLFDSDGVNIFSNRFQNCTFNIAGINQTRNVSLKNNEVVFTSNFGTELLFMNHDRNDDLFENIDFSDNIIDIRRSPDLNYNIYFKFKSGKVEGNVFKMNKNKFIHKGRGKINMSNNKF